MINKSRQQESEWLSNLMNSVGKSNLELHEALTHKGFTGGVTNISLWRSGSSQIPDRWIVDICHFLYPENEDKEVLKFLRQRHPHLVKFINLANTKPSPALEKRIKPQLELYYIAKFGKNKGEKYLPYKNRKGNYQGGYDRFKESVEEFSELEALVERLISDDRFKVRMSIPDKPEVAPSLVSKKSLVIRR